MVSFQDFKNEYCILNKDLLDNTIYWTLLSQDYTIKWDPATFFSEISQIVPTTLPILSNPLPNLFSFIPNIGGSIIVPPI